LPEFISAKNLEPFITDELKETITNTIPYTALNGQKAVGIRANIIPRICDVWLRALSGGKLTEKQKLVAQTAHTLLSAFADIGITALVDEATGFQKEKDEYSRILQKYIAKELQSWVKTFGEDYYQQIYRLKGWGWDRFATDRKNHPWTVANITNRIVYEKLPYGVLEELKRLNPANEKGLRKHRYFQNLTPNEGYVHLLKHLGAIVNIMERYEDGEWEKALHEIDTRFPSQHDPYQLPLDFTGVNKHIFKEIIKKTSSPKPTKPE
ncbi:MAG: P63C domain-containing protein, partial [Patescibacteria group bacterium]|nr:P63C domain-containing protein [Patescibacteria group bacterium]